MAEDFALAEGTISEQYEALLPQLAAIIEGEKDLIANLANFTAILKQQFNWLWIGFYIVKEEQLVLGPFQGPIACTRISIGKGVCGKAWLDAKTIIVPNVDEFPGHIACSSLSKSEIVLPIILKQTVVGVLDIDSQILNSFSEIDQLYLEKMLLLLLPSWQLK